jgi:hypothetical protein
MYETYLPLTLWYLVPTALWALYSHFRQHSLVRRAVFLCFHLPVFMAPILSVKAHIEYGCPRLFGECYSDGYQSWTTEVSFPLSVYALILVLVYAAVLAAHGISRAMFLLRVKRSRLKPLEPR